MYIHIPLDNLWNNKQETGRSQLFLGGKLQDWRIEEGTFHCILLTVFELFYYVNVLPIKNNF